MDIGSVIRDLSPEEQAVVILETERNLYRNSLYLTAKILLQYSEMNWATHGEMISDLESDRLCKLIVMPRGTFKTSIAVVAYAIWRLLRNPNLRILIDSELFSNAKRSLREICQHLESERLTGLFGQFRGDMTWNESEIFIAQRQIIKKEASITVSGIGAQKTGQHYDIIIGDDLNSAQNSNTKEGREKVVAHYRMYTSLLDPGGEKIIIGTRYHEDDILGVILRNEVFLPDQDIDEDYKPAPMGLLSE